MKRDWNLFWASAVQHSVLDVVVKKYQKPLLRLTDAIAYAKRMSVGGHSVR